MKQFKKLILLSPCIIPLSLLASCRGNNIPTGNVVWANYESYMGGDIIKKYSSDVTFLYYSTDDMIMNKFKSNYDIAIPSANTIFTLLKKGYLSQVEWSLFGLKDANGKVIETGKEVLENLIASTDDTNTTYDSGSDVDLVVESIDQWLVEHKDEYLPEEYLSTHDDTEISILDWTVPYFLQSLSFSYWGDENLFEGSDPTWTTIRDQIRDNPIFDVKHPSNKISLVDDYRTIYDFSKLYENEQTGLHDINPPADVVSEQAFKKTYQDFAQFGNSHKFYLNTDSVELANAFFGDFNTKKGTGILCYNADAVYAGCGLGQHSDEFKLVEGWFQADSQETALVTSATPEETAMIMDGIVFNKALDNDQKRKEQAYSYVRDICLDHIDYENEDYEDEYIDDTNEAGDYVYDSFNNFDNVMYVSPWEAIDSIVWPGTDPEGADYYDYFSDYIWYLIYEESGYGYVDEDGVGKIDPKILEALYGDDIDVGDYDDYVPEGWVSYLKNAFAITYPSSGLDESGNVDITQGFYSELSLNDLQKSNMHWAYEKSKHLF